MHLKFFTTHTEYEAYINSEDAVLPNVSYCEDNDEVHYNPKEQPIVETDYNTTININQSGNTYILGVQEGAETSWFDAIVFDGQPIDLDELYSNDGYFNIQTAGEHSILYIPKDKTKIKQSTFNSTKITSLNSNETGTCIIPNGVTLIDEDAFAGCNGLTTVFMPDSITELGPTAFANCMNLTSVTIEATTPPEVSVDALPFKYISNPFPIYVPAASVNDYKTAEGWEEYASRIEAIL